MSKNHSRMGDKTNKDKSPEFKENQKLEEYSSVVIDSPNIGKCAKNLFPQFFGLIIPHLFLLILNLFEKK